MESDNVTAVWGAESGHIGVAVQDAVAVVTLRRPDKLNALTADACRELAAISDPADKERDVDESLPAECGLGLPVQSRGHGV
jgi:hypothetical protein